MVDSPILFCTNLYREWYIFGSIIVWTTSITGGQGELRSLGGTICLKENVLSSATETRLKVGFAEGATQFVNVSYWTVHFYMHHICTNAVCYIHCIK